MRSILKLEHRLNRRGAFRVDMMMMILVLMLTIAAVVFAFIKHGSYKEEGLYLSYMEGVVERQQAEWTRLKQAAAHACEPLGFRGPDGGISDEEAMLRFFDSMSDTQYKPKVESIAANAKEQPKDSGGIAVSSTEWAKGSKPKLSGVAVRQESNWTFDVNNASLKKLISAQDMYINDLVTDFLPTYLNERKRERGHTDAERSAFEATVDEKANEWNGSLVDGETQIRDQIDLLASAEEDARTAKAAMRSEIDTIHTNLSSKQGEVEDQIAAIRDPRRAAIEAHDAAVTMLSERIGFKARQNAFDGTIVQYDPVSGYAWINLGQADNVRIEMSFSVSAPSEDRESMKPVGEIRVKQVLGDHLSRCRVDVLEDPALLPARGHLIRNLNYDPQEYRRYLFIGKFGSDHTKYTKQQLSDVLHRFDKVVVEDVESDIEVLVLGDDWDKDERYVAINEALLRGKVLSFETMTERELLYTFGVTGPDDVRE